MPGQDLPTLLIVDDVDGSLSPVKPLLDDGGMVVITVNTLTDAINAASAKEFALILLPMQSRELDVFDILKQLKALSLNAATPVVFVSLHVLEHNQKLRVYRAGAVDIIYAPIEFEILRLKVQLYLDLYHLRVVERCKYLHQLELSEAKLAVILETAPAGVLTINKDGVIDYMNRAGQEVWGGFPNAERPGFDDEFRAFWPETGEPLDSKEWACSQAFLTGTPIKPRRVRILTLDGKEKFISAAANPILDRKGNVIGAVGVNQDITDAVRFENELRRAKDEAERANALKSAFLANMSHEIRTPLGAMLGFAGLLKDPGLSNSERSSFVDILSRNGEQLSIIINDILDLSKVEAGHLSLEYTNFYPANVAEETLSLLRVKAKDKDLVLEYIADGTAPHHIVSDPTRVRQVLLNLVSNAIKFTRYGSVTIKSYGCRTERGRDAACFEVTDTGIGIPEDKRESIFKPFIQADNSMTRRFGGTGLGLALSRQLARAMGGDITILKSVENVGTTFVFKVEDQPHERPQIASSQPMKKLSPEDLNPEVLKGVRVLVVDDSPDNQALLWRFLTKYGAIVDSAENGYLGYRKALAAEFDIILMDLQMPEMDGYTATHKLRSAGYLKPIIALTAHALSEIRQKCLNVGCTAHLPKPIDWRDLITTVADLTSGP